MRKPCCQKKGETGLKGEGGAKLLLKRKDWEETSTPETVRRIGQAKSWLIRPIIIIGERGEENAAELLQEKRGGVWRGERENELEVGDGGLTWRDEGLRRISGKSPRKKGNCLGGNRGEDDRERGLLLFPSDEGRNSLIRNRSELEKGGRVSGGV